MARKSAECQRCSYFYCHPPIPRLPAMGACLLTGKRWQSLEAVYYLNASRVLLVPLLSSTCTVLPHTGSVCWCFQPIRCPLSGRIRSKSFCSSLDFYGPSLWAGRQYGCSLSPPPTPIHLVGFRRGHGDHSTYFETVNMCILV